MEFGGVVGMDGLVGVSSEGVGAFPSSSLACSDPELGRQKGLFASGLLKHGRSGGPEDLQDWRSLKVGRTEAMLAAPALAKAASCALRSNSHSLFPDGGQMLSFSSASSAANRDAMVLTGDGTLPYYHHPSASSSAPSCYRNAAVAGLLSGSSNSNMRGVLARMRGPFTPSQWMELEHQALIYKYFVLRMPIPPNLLEPIRRSLNQSGAGSGQLVWGSVNLGYSGNSDPEPGRCRRTDGKKWRCSRDAVADQKYCERHMNRGRHRSRKLVEGQGGNVARAMPSIAASEPLASTPSGGGSSSTINIGPQQAKGPQPNSTDPGPSQLKKIWMSNENGSDCMQDVQSLSMLTSMNSKSTNTTLSMSEQSSPLEGTSSRAEGLILTESFLKPYRSFYSKSIRFIPTPKLSEQQSEPQPLRQFINDWPNAQSDCSTITWPKVEETHSDRTHLSISIPMASSDFSSSSSSNQENLALSPLKLSRDFDPIHMGLGVGGVLNEASQRQVNCIPLSWEASMGGPLGEVLTSTSSTPVDQTKNCSSSSLNLLTDGWDLSPRLEASPTGVLQKTSFGSLTSSTGSSPRAENHKGHDSIGSMDDDFLGSTLVNPPTFTSL